eukprot:scaffold139_cov199-Alexandrium_tamarense.AAC.23
MRSPDEDNASSSADSSDRDDTGHDIHSEGPPNVDHEESSITLKDININIRREMQGSSSSMSNMMISSITLNDITSPYYNTTRIMYHNNLQRSPKEESEAEVNVELDTEGYRTRRSSMSTVSNEDIDATFDNSRDIESLMGDDSYRLDLSQYGQSGKLFSASLDPQESGFFSVRGSGDSQYLSWRKSMGGILQEIESVDTDNASRSGLRDTKQRGSENSDVGNDDTNDDSSGILSTKLEQAISTGLMLIDLEKKQLRERYNKEIVSYGEKPSAKREPLLPIEEIIGESLLSQEEELERRLSRSLSFLDRDKHILMSLKGNGSYNSLAESNRLPSGGELLAVEGNDETIDSKKDAVADRRVSRGLSLLEKGRSSLLSRESFDGNNTETSGLNISAEVTNANTKPAAIDERRISRGLSLIEKRDILLAFANSASSFYGNDGANFSWGSEDDAQETSITRASEENS